MVETPRAKQPEYGRRRVQEHTPSRAHKIAIQSNERVAGLIHIGTPKAAQEERPRPPLSEIVTRI